MKSPQIRLVKSNAETAGNLPEAPAGARKMNYGFLINTETCIGCHACSTACKSENEVPLGVNRTWVKYTERGEYPDVKRSFQVTRCNHCVNPPCVRICPVTAMYQREDGIVEFDSDQCIGCKACMQACPYDAIYIDPDTHTASKCHYCSHRVDIGLEPACAVVCPTHSIVAGDLDDPESEIRKVASQHSVTVRKPEQGTGPKVLYVGGDSFAQHPTSVESGGGEMMFTDRASELRSGGEYQSGLVQIRRNKKDSPASAARLAPSGAKIRTPGEQGLAEGGPIQFGEGSRAEQMVQVAYNAQHKIPWHWPVPAYLVTKGIAAGLMFLLCTLWALGIADFDAPTMVVGGGAALLATVVTTILLVMDLERPERFLRIVFSPQWKSWLTRGAFLLIIFSTLLGIWWTAELAVSQEWVAPFAGLETLRSVGIYSSIPLSIGVAAYTAFLFAQAEGRDLWQSSLLPVHLVVQALMIGSGSMLVLDLLFSSLSPDLIMFSRIAFVSTLFIDLAMLIGAEYAMPHASEVAARASHEIHAGKYKSMFWWGAVVMGHVAPLTLLFGSDAPVLAALAAVFAGIGLYFYEYAFVMAPQEIPNS